MTADSSWASQHPSGQAFTKRETRSAGPQPWPSVRAPLRPPGFQLLREPKGQLVRLGDVRLRMGQGLRGVVYRLGLAPALDGVP